MQTQMYVPNLSKVNKYIIIIHVGLFIINSIMQATAGMSLSSFLGLSLAGVSKGMVYQIATFPFIETNFLSVLFNSMLIWFIGADLENRWGQSFYVKFLAISATTSGAIYLLASALGSSVFMYTPLQGLGGIVFALLIAYGIIFSERQLTFMLLFPMKAKYFCMILAGIELYMGLFSANGKAAWAHLAAGAAGYAYLKWKSMKARGQSLSSMLPKRSKKRGKGKLRIVGDEEPKRPDPKDPKYWQ